MRTPLLLLASLVLVACGSDRRAPSSEPGAPRQALRGPDAVLLRVPRAGGRVAAYVYPNLDSAVWRSGESAPALDRVLAFDGEGGLLAAVDARGIPVRIDLRLGTVRRASDTPLADAASIDGVDIFGVSGGNTVTRLTPSGGAWSVRLPGTVQRLEPQRDGAVLVAGHRGDEGVVWRLRPPGTRVTDSAVVAGAARSIGARTPERVFFLAGRQLTAVQSRSLQRLDAVTFDAPVHALAATPSGDRFYAALDGTSQLSVLDRYSNAVGGSIELPGAAGELRMDPLGRYVLAQAAKGDSAWVVAVGTDKVLGAIRTAWRPDLPLVLPDGAILTAVGNDVVLVDGHELTARRTVAGGAADLWHLVTWNGFRPRAAGLDQPVRFQSADTTADTTTVDSSAAKDSTARPDSTKRPPVPPDTSHAPSYSLVSLARVPTAEAAAAPKRGYTVQFAAAGSEREARLEVVRLRLPKGMAARIVPTIRRTGKTVFRVVVGPFATWAEAERIAKSTGHEYWIYPGIP